jgi:hypothetical protein
LEKEWQADAGKSLDIPDSVLSRLHHKVSIRLLNVERSVLCWCESFEYEPMIQTIRLKYALVDTSDRYKGITLMSRRTLFNDLQFLGQFSVTVLPIENKDDKF